MNTFYNYNTNTQCKYPDNYPSICIKEIDTNISKDFIINLFNILNLGCIENIQFATKTKKDGIRNYRIAFIHFSYWYSSISASNFRRKVINKQEVKLIYDDPKFWYISKNNIQQCICCGFSINLKNIQQDNCNMTINKNRVHIYYKYYPERASSYEERQKRQQLLKTNNYTKGPVFEQYNIIENDENDEEYTTEEEYDENVILENEYEDNYTIINNLVPHLPLPIKNDETHLYDV